MRTSKADRLSDPDAHTRLKQLYLQLCPEGMTQERFGEVSGIGSQGMVWQFLNGHTPLTVEAAARFAKTLGCTIYDISPMLDAAIRADILPVLTMRKKLRRAAALALFLALSNLSASHNTDAHYLFAPKYMTQYTFWAIQFMLRCFAKLSGWMSRTEQFWVVKALRGMLSISDGIGLRHHHLGSQSS